MRKARLHKGVSYEFSIHLLHNQWDGSGVLSSNSVNPIPTQIVDVYDIEEDEEEKKPVIEIKENAEYDILPLKKYKPIIIFKKDKKKWRTI